MGLLLITPDDNIKASPIYYPPDILAVIHLLIQEIHLWQTAHINPANSLINSLVNSRWQDRHIALVVIL